jgi:uroporphyrinogen-III synthase
MFRVWVTRDEPRDGPLCNALSERGLQPVWCPVVERRLLPAALDVLADLREDDWLVLTSPFAVQAVAPIAAPRGAHVAVVGESSRKLAQSLGLKVEWMSAEADAAGLLSGLAAQVSSGRVFYLHSTQAPTRTGWPGVEWIDRILYETVPRPFDRMAVGVVDIVAVASPSAVRAVGDAALLFASIGKTTSEAIRELGGRVEVEASTPSLDALAEAIRGRAYPSRDQRA